MLRILWWTTPIRHRNRPENSVLVMKKISPLPRLYLARPMIVQIYLHWEVLNSGVREGKELFEGCC